MPFKIIALLLILIFGSFIFAKVYETGPIIWLKRSARRSRALEGADRRELVARVQQLLPQEERRVFLLRYWFGDPIREIARRTGWGESRVKVTLLRTRRKLRDYLEGEGISV